MATRNTTNDHFNHAINNTGSREYVFAPVSNRVKLVIFSAMLFFGVYGMIGNSLILYFKHKQHRRRRNGIQRSFSRSLTEYFINSLALSDVLCSLVSFPLFASEMFIDFVHNDWICKVNRFLNIVFPVVTILNLLTIGIERYFSIFHPFSFLSRRKAKKMVLGAWVLGVLLTLVPMPTYKLIDFDIDHNSYTLICKYDNSHPLYRSLFISFTVLIYIIPSFILIFINLRILVNIRQRKRRVAPGQQEQISNRNISIAVRFKATRMFMWLMLAFIIPYLLFIIYNSLMMILRLELSFTTDYVARHISALLAYANGAVSATIFFHNENGLRKMLRDMLCRSFAQSDQSQGDSKDENNQQQSSC